MSNSDLTVDDICKRHNLCSGYVRKEIKAGRLAAYRFGNGRRGPLRIPYEDYEQWLEFYRVSPQPRGAW